MIGPLRPRSHARAIVQPKPSLLCLPVRRFQPFASPLAMVPGPMADLGSPFDPFMVHMPAAVVRHAGDQTAAIASELSRQFDDVPGHRAARHPPHLGQALRKLRPLMNGKTGHRGIEMPIVEGQAFCNGINGLRKMLRALRPHGAEGSTGVTLRAIGSYEPAPAPMFRTLRAGPSATCSRAVIRGSGWRHQVYPCPIDP